MSRNIQCTIALAATVVFFAGLTSPARAVLFTDSNQLNLAGRDVLSAVSFYTPGGVQFNGAVQVTSPLQGVNVTNFPDSTTTIGELTISVPNVNSDRGQSGASITGTGIDQTPATQVASSVTYWAGSQTGFLNYSFGPSYANKLVEVQIVGGESGWSGSLDFLVGGDFKGNLTGDTNINTADLLTFSAITNGSGDLLVNINKVGGNFYGIAGAFVTTAFPVPVPEPSSLMLLGMGTLCLANRTRRRKDRV